MQPRAEMVHWLFASGVLVLGLILIAQAIAGPAVWAKRPWRVYLWPGIAFGLGILMWPVMTFYTNSAIHMVAHSVWAQALMVMGAAELGLAKGKLSSRFWHLAAPVGIAFSGLAFLVHEQNPWFFSRSAFLHHLIGWTFIVGALAPLALAFRPRSAAFQAAFAAVIVVVSIQLFADRDVAPVFGHLSPLAGQQHR